MNEYEDLSQRIVDKLCGKLDKLDLSIPEDEFISQFNEISLNKAIYGKPIDQLNNSGIDLDNSYVGASLIVDDQHKSNYFERHENDVKYNKVQLNNAKELVNRLKQERKERRVRERA